MVGGLRVKQRWAIAQLAPLFWVEAGGRREGSPRSSWVRRIERQHRLEGWLSSWLQPSSSPPRLMLQNGVGGRDLTERMSRW